MSVPTSSIVVNKEVLFKTESWPNNPMKRALTVDNASVFTITDMYGELYAFQVLCLPNDGPRDTPWTKVRLSDDGEGAAGSSRRIFMNLPGTEPLRIMVQFSMLHAPTEQKIYTWTGGPQDMTRLSRDTCLGWTIHHPLDTDEHLNSFRTKEGHRALLVIEPQAMTREQAESTVEGRKTERDINVTVISAAKDATEKYKGGLHQVDGKPRTFGRDNEAFVKKRYQLALQSVTLMRKGEARLYASMLISLFDESNIERPTNFRFISDDHMIDIGRRLFDPNFTKDLQLGPLLIKALYDLDYASFIVERFTKEALNKKLRKVYDNVVISMTAAYANDYENGDVPKPLPPPAFNGGGDVSGTSYFELHSQKKKQAKGAKTPFKMPRSRSRGPPAKPFSEGTTTTSRDRDRSPSRSRGRGISATLSATRGGEIEEPPFVVRADLGEDEDHFAPAPPTSRSACRELGVSTGRIVAGEKQAEVQTEKFKWSGDSTLSNFHVVFMPRFPEYIVDNAPPTVIDAEAEESKDNNTDAASEEEEDAAMDTEVPTAAAPKPKPTATPAIVSMEQTHTCGKEKINVPRGHHYAIHGAESASDIKVNKESISLNTRRVTKDDLSATFNTEFTLIMPMEIAMTLEIKATGHQTTTYRHLDPIPVAMVYDKRQGGPAKGYKYHGLDLGELVCVDIKLSWTKSLGVHGSVSLKLSATNVGTLTGPQLAFKF